MTAFKCLTTGRYFVCDTPSETEPAVSTVFQRSVCLYKKCKSSTTASGCFYTEK